MKWFVVSFISVVEMTQDIQDEYPVFEDFYLLSADTEEALQCKIAAEIALINSSGSSGLSYYQKPAVQRCLGVRKIRAIYNEADAGNEALPTDLTELTHSYMVTRSLQDAEKLVSGKAVWLNYVDNDPMND